MIFKDSKVYDTLKYIALVVLPPLEAFIIGLGEVWGIPIMAKVGASVALLATFLGALVVKSSKLYKRGDKEQDTFNEDSYEDMKGVPHYEDTDITAEQ